MTDYPVDNAQSLPTGGHSTPYVGTPGNHPGGSDGNNTISTPGTTSGAGPALTISTPKNSPTTPTSAMNGGMV